MDRYEQQANFFNILRIEKLLTILLLVFILLIASFNIIGSLSMLIIDKSEDIRILSHLGADEPTIRRVFLLEGWLISALGTLIGLVIGVALCLGQQHFGWLKLGSGEEYIISAYPVQVQVLDIIMVATTVALLGFLAAWYPTKKMKVAFLTLVAMIAISCSNSTPYVYRGMPKEYATAWEEIYGPCYDSVPYSVVALDLYSQGLELDENHRMRGTGYNLYISDIFVPDQEGKIDLRIVPGTYHSERSAIPFTFLPGKDWDGEPTGMYVLYVEEGKLQSIQVLDSGYIVVKDTTNGVLDLQFTLYYKNAYGSRVTYKPHYQGFIIPWRKK